ncbi:MAG: DEAD/DEAH box helicase [Patescibacteria group bacterium]
MRFVNSEGLFIMSEENPYKNYEFYLFARGNVENADVVVINHSLLFSDINSQNPFLGKMKYLVIDEAHNIEDSVTQSVQQKINEKSVKDIFDVIENILTKKSIKKIDFITQKETFLSSMDILMDYCASYVESKTPS